MESSQENEKSLKSHQTLWTWTRNEECARHDMFVILYKTRGEAGR